MNIKELIKKVGALEQSTHEFYVCDRPDTDGIAYYCYSKEERASDEDIGWVFMRVDSEKVFFKRGNIASEGYAMEFDTFDEAMTYYRLKCL